MSTSLVRYYIEHLPKHDDPHHESQKSQIHQHAREYHWVRLDDDTILGKAHFHTAHHASAAHGHPNVVVLKHFYDKTPVVEHIKEKGKSSQVFANKHAKLAQVFDLKSTDTTVDLVGQVLAKGFIQFEPQI